MSFFKTYSALSLIQSVKRIIVKGLRIRAKEVISSEVLDRLASEGYEVRKIDRVHYGILKDQKELTLRRGGSDLHVFNQVLLEAEYENLISLVDRYSHRDQVKCIVDAGANIGFTSLYLQRYFSQATIFAIEPSPENFSMLKRNVSSGAIVPIHAALFTHTTKMIVTNDFRDREAWSLRVKPDATGHGSIDAITLDQILQRAGGKQIDLFKMDIEGGEKALLADDAFCEILKKIKFIAFELHEEVIDRIKTINQLQSLGFELTYKGETLFGINKAAL